MTSRRSVKGSRRFDAEFWPYLQGPTAHPLSKSYFKILFRNIHQFRWDLLNHRQTVSFITFAILYQTPISLPATKRSCLFVITLHWRSVYVTEMTGSGANHIPSRPHGSDWRYFIRYWCASERVIITTVQVRVLIHDCLPGYSESLLQNRAWRSVEGVGRWSCDSLSICDTTLISRRTLTIVWGILDVQDVSEFGSVSFIRQK